MAEHELWPIGRVESGIVDRAVAPKQGHEGAPEAVVVLDDAVLPGARDLQVGMPVMVLTWLHQADRDTLLVHPRDVESAPLTGVFSTRSADRPNPIGLHRVTILAIDGPRLRVRDLEAVDGTPVLDIKPVLDGAEER